MGSFGAWIVFVTAFVTSLVSMCITFLSRQDLHVLRSIADDPSARNTDEYAFDDAGDDQVYRTDGGAPAGAEALALHGETLETPRRRGTKHC